jgi:hypothetical protein
MVNGEEFDLATDVYTLGLVFIELLSRRLAARWLFTVCAHSRKGWVNHKS